MQKIIAIKTTEMMMPSRLAAAKLRQEIRSGCYAVGERLSSEPLLAKKMGVNRGTIRKALTMLEQERLIARQRGHGTFVTSPASIRNASTSASMIGVMVYEKEYYFGAILQEAFAYSSARGYILSTSSNANQETENLNTEAFIKNGVLGVILAPLCHSVKTYERLDKANIPVVMIDSLLPNVNEDFVSIHNQQGIFLITQHLINLGHKRIGYVGHNNHADLPCYPERLAGYLNACRMSGIQLSEKWQLEAASYDAEDYIPKLRRFLSQENRPTAIVSYNDTWAIRIIQVARELQLKVPQDLSVTGFDDSAVGRAYDVPLTTVSPEPQEIGITAIDLLIAKIEGAHRAQKRSILITPNLIIRKSTAQFI